MLMSSDIKSFKITKFACFFSYVAMSSVFSLPPLLFLTFRETYGISYTLLGTLVLINFCTQLAIDLTFTFFSKFFNIKLTVRIMPLLTSLGLVIYALVPTFAPDYAYTGLVIGTVIFSVAAGLCEVLLSPLVAAIPSKNPERDMSLLHSLYAWGVLAVVLISTLFLHFAGTDKWMYLTLFWAALPIICSILYCMSPFPDLDVSNSSSHSSDTGRKKILGLALCTACIFIGGAAENSMTNWISAYMESALRIPKIFADIVGLALFAMLLGLGRTLYAKYGKNISRVLLLGMIGATACYIVAGLSPNVILSAIACVLTGFCTSMLWPGTLILMEEKIPAPGVAAYALMAAGGDLGSSIAPQLLGIITDTVSASAFAKELSEKLSLSPEQIGMKAGMLTAALFPLIGVFLLLFIIRYYKKHAGGEKL